MNKTISLFVAMLAIVAAPALLHAGNGSATTYEELLDQHMEAFEDKSPVELARMFANPNGYATGFVVQAMVQRGEEGLPLLQKLLHDDHPLVRETALAALIEIRRIELENTQGPRDTPEIRDMLKQMKSLVEDPTMGPKVADFVILTELDLPETREIALMLAQSSEIDVRNRALKMARFIKHPDTLVKMGTYATMAPKNIPRSYGTALGLILRHIDDPVSDQGIVAAISFLRDRANTEPVRGMFSDGPQINALKILDAKWSDDLLKQEGAVEAVCRTYVRGPMSLYPGWMTARLRSSKLVTQLNRASVAEIRRTVEIEKKWLAESDNTALGLASQDGPARAKYQQNIDYLIYVADTLEAGETIKHEPANLPKEPKEYEDKVGDPNEIDLDNILDDL